METCSFDSLFLSGHRSSRQFGRKCKKRKAPLLVDKIIDMRGPHDRVITDFNTLNKKPKITPMNIIKPTQRKQIHNKRKERVAEKRKERVVNELDHNIIRNESDREKKRIDDNNNDKNIEEDIVIELNHMLTLEILAETYMDLQIRYGTQYVSLSNITCSYALPLFTKMFQGCDLLKSPTYGVDIVRKWKRLLLLGDNSDMYTRLLKKILYPVAGVAIRKRWQAREPMPMLRFFDSWKELLPRGVFDHILDDFIVPKLLVTVNSWDPVTEKVPIHCWIHPWLPLLGRKLESCYGTIYLGFARAIRGWKHTDMSVAYDLLSPWKTVFDSVSWEKLVWRHVLPKLTSVMQDMKISRANQATDQFRRIQMWASVVHVDYMLRIMDIFFDKWQDVLFIWLRQKPNFEEVGKWFMGWKESLHIEMQANEHIRYRLSIGLQMINRVAEGLEVNSQCAGVDNDLRAEDTCGAIEMSLKEVIQFHAEINGLEFKPKYGRKKDGRQVYGFGSISIVIDSANERMFAWVEEGWSLVTLCKLLELQHCTSGEGQQ